MTNTARHLIGALIGIVVTPLAWYGMTAPVQSLFKTIARLAPPTFSDTVLPLFALLVVAVILALLAGAPFISPVAPLIVGAVNLLFGLAWPLAESQLVGAFSWLPGGLSLTTPTSAATGTYLIVGAVLLGSAALPHRWRSRTGTPAAATGGPGGPAGPGGPYGPAGGAPYAGPSHPYGPGAPGGPGFPQAPSDLPPGYPSGPSDRPAGGPPAGGPPAGGPPPPAI